MSDIFEILLTLDLSNEIPEQIISELQWHLGLAANNSGELDNDLADEYHVPLFTQRGPSGAIGGVSIAELIRKEPGWSLTVRQECTHEDFPILRHLLDYLAPYVTSHGPIGQLRFNEEFSPYLLIVQSRRVMKLFTWSAGEDDSEEFLAGYGE